MEDEDKSFNIKFYSITVLWFLVVLIAWVGEAPQKFYPWWVMVSALAAPIIHKIIALSKGEGHGNFMDDYGMPIGFFGAIIFFTIIMF